MSSIYIFPNYFEAQDNEYIWITGFVCKFLTSPRRPVISVKANAMDTVAFKLRIRSILIFFMH